MNSQDTAQEIAGKVATNIINGMKSFGGEAGSECLGVAISGAFAALGCVALATTNAYKTKKPTADHIAFAAALVIASCHVNEHAAEKVDTAVAICPDSFLEGMQLFEKITGRKPDGFLQKSFLEFVNQDLKLSDEQKAAFAKFLPPETKH